MRGLNFDENDLLYLGLSNAAKDCASSDTCCTPEQQGYKPHFLWYTRLDLWFSCPETFNPIRARSLREERGINLILLVVFARGPQQGRGPEICGAPLVLYLHSRSLTNVRRRSASSFDFVFGNSHNLIWRYASKATLTRWDRCTGKNDREPKIGRRSYLYRDLSCHVLMAADQTSGAGKVGMTDSVKDAISRTQFHW